MCEFCGCEAVPVIEGLMADHVWITTRVHRILDAVDRCETEHLEWQVAGLARTFTHHALVEEAGLLAELADAGQAGEEVMRLTAEHRQIEAGLASYRVSSLDQLRAVLALLLRHDQDEDDRLFPLAMQNLPTERWDRVEVVHQVMLTA